MDRPDGFSGRPSPMSTSSSAARRNGAHAAQKSARNARLSAERAELRTFTWASRQRRRRWGVSLGSIGALVLAVILLTVSPLLSLRHVVIEGANRLDPAQVEQALASLQGEPLARVSSPRVGEALAGITLIQAFETRIEPPGTLVVSIVERKPIGVVASATGYAVVDAAAVTLWFEALVPRSLPLILVAADPDSDSFGAISRVLLALPDDLLVQVEGVTATSLDDVRFTIRGTAHEVVWGSSDRVGEKARVLSAALVAAGSTSSRIIDVTTPESVVIRAKG
jgi:cell division protein FtsQ